MNTYPCTDGSRISQKDLDNAIKKTKREMRDRQIMAIGYEVCTVCWENDCKPVDCSHHISVQKCKDMGRAELAAEATNMALIGRNCHQVKDGLNLQFNG